MNKVITRTLLALVGLTMLAFTAQAQSTPPSGTPYITMTVTNGATVQIAMWAAADSTPVWVETSPGSYAHVTVGSTYWTSFLNYTANDTTVKVHGNLKGFICERNTTNLTGLTFSSGLTNLQYLYCDNNSITSLDVSGLTNLKLLACDSNFLTSLDVSELTNLRGLWCYNNSITSLNVSGLTNLEDLHCNTNSLTTLDVSGLTNLKTLGCSCNFLTSLDVSGLTNLKSLSCDSNFLTAFDASGLTSLERLWCFSNPFSTQAIDDIYCSLPQRTAADSVVIYPDLAGTAADHDIVLATNKQNATDKNWQVLYYGDDTDIPTTGTYECGTTGIADITAAEQLSIYPNPAKDMVTVELNESHKGVLQIVDISGKTLISHKINGTHVSVNVSTLSKGMYFVKVGSKVNKLIIE